ncbi:hypothetical protein DICPUDRAFT_83386 [Dictyostelium purpureum]|uniref:Uncharacterized protein n=1 Tax=Dictyostelium purpureum TaxID=5786 RepID=F0ZZD7_DICPU|nr:uncharacterized protein DICPUDRAFT_83386 [Dictyostelium purpureum]EGC30688.1 hypothetical protein DICPUDRAFT_83386 [Dictyostelium purpureum]|eukprot:XP_003292786.1 hypothetical protein DICPUDRAFT_83386 [Dictyostelium purpureum]
MNQIFNIISLVHTFSLKSILFSLPIIFLTLTPLIIISISNIRYQTRCIIKKFLYQFLISISVLYNLFQLVTCLYWVINTQYYQLLGHSIKFLQFYDTIVILSPILICITSIFLVVIKDRVLKKIKDFKINQNNIVDYSNQNHINNEILNKDNRLIEIKTYQHIIRIIYIYMFIFLFLLVNIGKYTCYRVKNFEKIGICNKINHNQLEEYSSMWVAQALLNCSYIILTFPILEFLNNNFI